MMWTTRPPAKSSTPRVLIQPFGPHTQCATTEYTTIAHTGTKAIHATNLARSAIAPLTNAAVTIAKVN